MRERKRLRSVLQTLTLGIDTNSVVTIVSIQQINWPSVSTRKMSTCRSMVCKGCGLYHKRERIDVPK
jgi:hypothetical protein